MRRTIKRWAWRPTVLLLAAALTFAGLVFLGWVQYRWVDQLRRTQAERMRAAAERAAAAISEDFNLEAARAVSPARGAPASDVTRAIYLADAHLDTLLILSSREGLEGKNVPWPGNLERLRARLETAPPPEGGPRPDLVVDEAAAAFAVRRGGPPGGLGFGPGFAPGFGRRSAPPPFARLPFAGDPGPGPLGDGPPRAAWLIAELDLDYLRGAWFPRLTARYLDKDMVAAIVPRAGGAPIYAPADGLPPGPPEAVAGMLLLRPGLPAQGGSAPPPAPWEVRVWYRSGPLEEAVRETWLRNLAIGFGVLLALSISLGLLLLASRSAQRLARLQMDFVSGVSHELRTPLAVIGSAADNLAGGYVRDPDQVRRYGSLVAEEGRRLAHMVEQILRFASLESGRTRLAADPVDVDDIFREALSACAGEIAAARCEVEQRIDEATPSVLGDTTALVHCVRNLVSNGVKYGGGRWLRLSARPGGAMVEILVEDAGPGIPEDEASAVFQPFFRGRDSAAQTRGLGLGLNLVKRLTEAQGGSVALRRREPEGACFILRLPAAKEN